MKIYAKEIEDGLEQTISAQSSIAYASLLEKSIDQSLNDKSLKAIAGLHDKDLYYTQSILVTTSWNKNDDIFDPEEVWIAKNTPIHKPTNLEHNENIIVGHITSNHPITDDNIIIDESTPVENLPKKFHILTGSVIYTGYTDQELKDRTSKLIAEIEDGTKYVSMECFFNGFDYGLSNKATGEYKILSRNDDTAYLTKHLRAYGGLGEHEDYKIGRVLRHITFSGKGFVDKPANPESVIFTKTEKNKEKTANFLIQGVSLDQANEKETNMSLEKEVAEIKEQIQAIADCNNAVAEAKTIASDLEQKNLELTKALESRDIEINDIKVAIAEKEEAAKKMKDDMDKMKAEFDAANEILAAYKDKEAEMMKKEKKMKRMATLLESGLDTELATSTVEKFDHLDDNSFDGLVEVFAAMKPKKDEKKEEMPPMKKQASETETITEEVLDNVETEDSVVISVGSEDSVSDTENTRAALIDFVYSRLGKTLNKGE
jgi:hypothetical protein